MKNHILVLALGSAMVLSACGGGGGGGGSTGGTGSGGTGTGGTTTPPVSTLSTITAANSAGAASNAYAATTSVGASSNQVTEVLAGVSIGGTGINTVAPVLRLVKGAYGGAQLLTGVVQTETCAGGGTLSRDATVANSQNPSNGDIITVTATNCVDSGQTLNGALSIKFSGVTGTLSSGVFTVTMDSTFTNFNIASSTDKVNVNGDMKIAVNQASATDNTIAISGTSLQTTEQQGSAAAVNRTITAYTVTGKTQGTTISSAANFGLSGTSTALGTFSYTVQSKTPFVFNNGATVPSSGSLVVNGNASSVTATVVSSGVQLDFSNNATGTVTSTNTLAWAAFLGSI